ncbi:GTP-binding protein, partial [Klebsiella pneumoniae]|uniref:GTP-binding protein n=1 Tax=Klebsiella pneumoniae TaxID=573 RepID=UPI003968EC45
HAALSPVSLEELRCEHSSETEDFGITSFVFRARRPFHPTRFWQVMENELDGDVRSKGNFWLASRPRFAGSWSQAGGIARQGLGGMWGASVTQAR